MPGYLDRSGRLYPGARNVGAGGAGIAQQTGGVQMFPGVQARPYMAGGRSAGLALPALPSMSRDPNQVASPMPVAGSPGAQLQALTQASLAVPQQAGAAGPLQRPTNPMEVLQQRRAAWGAQQAGQGAAPAAQQQIPGGIHPAVLAAMTPEAALAMQRLEEMNALEQRQGQYDQAIQGLQAGAALAQQQVGEGVDIAGMMGEPGLDDRFWTAQRDLAEQKVGSEHGAIIQRAKEQAISQGWYGTGMWDQRLQELETAQTQAMMGAMGDVRTEQAGMMREDRYRRAQLEVQQALGLAPYEGQYTYGAAQDVAGLLTQRPVDPDMWTQAYDWLQSHEGDQMQLLNPDGTMRALTPAEEARILADIQGEQTRLDPNAQTAGVVYGPETRDTSGFNGNRWPQNPGMALGGGVEPGRQVERLPAAPGAAPILPPVYDPHRGMVQDPNTGRWYEPGQIYA